MIVATVGCADVAEVDDLEQALVPPTPCVPYRCSNSPEVIRYGMHELHLRGIANKQDVTFELTGPIRRQRAALYKDGVPWELYIDKGLIEGRRGLARLQGSALVGAELHLLRLGQPLYNIKIERVRQIFMQVGRADPVWVYKLSWYEQGGAIGKNICNGANSLPENDLDLYERYRMKQDETLLFTGDRIDVDSLTMVPEPSNSWVNFGCASYTLAKMFLSRNTSASAWDGITDKEGNQAQLKMYTGDYCNTGDPITVSGTNMIWTSKKTDYFGAPSDGDIEARWTANGATCLNTMRLEVHPSPHLVNPRGRLTCELPSCAPGPYDFGPDGLRISANYMP